MFNNDARPGGTSGASAVPHNDPATPSAGNRRGTFAVTGRDLALIAMFAALAVVLARPEIPIPGPTPLTLQTLVFMLAASLLGFPRGALAVLLYIGLIAIGLPVAAGGRGGIAVLTGPTGGYLIGSVIGALVTGYLLDRFGRRNLPIILIANIIGMMAIVYAVGIPWQAQRTGSAVFAALSSSTAYFPGDLIKVVLTGLIVTTVVRAYPKILQRA